MGVIADLIAAGVAPELVERVHLEILTGGKQTSAADRAAEKRRAWDRERQARRRADEKASADEKPVDVHSGHPVDAPPSPFPQRDIIKPPNPAPDLPLVGPRERAPFSEKVLDMTRRLKAVYPNWTGGSAVSERLRILAKRKDFDFEAVLAGAERYAAKMRDEPERFIVQPAKWLKDGRWADESRKAAAQMPTGKPRSRDRRGNGFWISREDPFFDRWAAYRRTGGQGPPPTDAHGGWIFPALEPPKTVMLVERHAGGG